MSEQATEPLRQPVNVEPASGGGAQVRIGEQVHQLHDADVGELIDKLMRYRAARYRRLIKAQPKGDQE